MNCPKQKQVKQSNKGFEIIYFYEGLLNQMAAQKLPMLLYLSKNSIVALQLTGSCKYYFLSMHIH